MLLFIATSSACPLPGLPRLCSATPEAGPLSSHLPGAVAASSLVPLSAVLQSHGAHTVPFSESRGHVTACLLGRGRACTQAVSGSTRPSCFTRAGDTGLRPRARPGGGRKLAASPDRPCCKIGPSGSASPPAARLPRSVSPAAVKGVPLPPSLTQPPTLGTGLWAPPGPRDKADGTLPHTAPRGVPVPAPQAQSPLVAGKLMGLFDLL